MSKTKAPELPPVPTYQTDPVFKSGLDQMMSVGNDLISGNFAGNLNWLQDTTTVNPDIIKGFFTGLQPSFQKMRQDTINTLAANGQLESSTTANALAQLDQNIADTMTGKVADLQTQALNNRLNLFGTGLNTITTGTGMAQSNQNALNDFNLKNYENMVAKTLAEQKQKSGGWLGALEGGAGGAALGIALAPFTGGASLMLPLAMGGAGALAGGLGPQGTGGSILSAGMGAAGSLGGGTNRLSGTFNNPARGIPGSSAFNSIGNDAGLSSRYAYLFGNSLN